MYNKIYTIFSALSIVFLYLQICCLLNLVSCHVSELCVNESKSCSHQIFANHSQECWMTYFKREECVRPIIPQKGISSNLNEDYGDVNIGAYLFTENGGDWVGLNVTFSKIKWKSLQMWFIEEPGTNNKTLPYVCRKFNVYQNISLEDVIFFDCNWLSNNDKEGSIFRFQYEVTDLNGILSFHDYLFKYPHTNYLELEKRKSAIQSLKKWKLFLIVDISEFRNSILQLKIQVAPSIFNITGYEIDLKRSSTEGGGGFSSVLKKPIRVNSAGSSFLKIKPHTIHKPGIYKYCVKMIHQKCKGEECVTDSPEIFYGPDLQAPVLIALVGIVLTVPLIIIIAGFFSWRRSWVSKQSGDPHQQTGVLFIYDGSFASHVADIIKFSNYLKEECKLNPLVDIQCIPNTRSKDPMRWLMVEAYQEAQFILVFASPCGLPSTEPHKLHPYAHLKEIAWNIYVTKKFNNIAKVRLRNCEWDTLPKGAERLKNKFIVPGELDKLLKFLGSNLKDKDKGFKAVLEQEPQQEQPISQCRPSLETISQNLPENVFKPRTLLGPDGVELVLYSDDEERKPLYPTGKSLNLNLSNHYS